ncbi:hypothetical protein [Methylovulum psychrotolerans]|uniref:Uncharacterized protein n=1 Tax=Methylovulum psychrotolerans TaxID=1704499 RepID=A0A1Z4C2L4_9GAMM|nr:hypothetical protein [Methylovulum psychrotolerans]ASF47755.1 hypothetical protein CEK71_17715 [Methylovulum psychrotolerans]
MKRLVAGLLVVAGGFGVMAAEAGGASIGKAKPCHRTEAYIPAGWCQPTKADMTEDWLAFKADYPIPYHTSGHFNGDAVKDEAWILYDEARKDWGVFVFLSQKGGGFAQYEVFKDQFGKINPQFISIRAAEKGEYETACGKGYWECAKGEPKKMTVKAGGALIMGPYESGGTELVYWHKTAFKKVSLDD